jgi:hypothetical protein
MYPPEKLAKYPHMLPADVDIWERFLDKYAQEYDGFDYDIHVGGVVERLARWSVEEHAVYSSLAAKRIDAVGHQGKRIVLFEVKPQGGVTAVGQLFAYRELYIKDFMPAETPAVALVCSNVLPDEVYVLNQLGAEVWVV